MRCDAMRCDAMRCDAMRCDAMRLSVSDFRIVVKPFSLISELHLEESKILFKLLRKVI